MAVLRKKSRMSLSSNALIQTFEVLKEELLSISSKVSSMEEKMLDLRKSNEDISRLLIAGGEGSVTTKLLILQTEFNVIKRDMEESLKDEKELDSRLKMVEEFKTKMLAIAGLAGILSGIFSSTIVNFFTK